MSEHPKYATCYCCTQGVGIAKNGTVKRHTRKVAYGNLLASVVCAGTGEWYAERDGYTWDPFLRKFKRLPLAVPVSVRTFPDSNAGIEENFASVVYTEIAERGLGILKNGGYSLHAYPNDENLESVTLELVDADKRTILRDSVVNDGASLNGRLLTWLEILTSRDFETVERFVRDESSEKSS